MNNDFNLFDEMFGQPSFSEILIPDSSKPKENKPSIHAEAIQTDIKPSAPVETASADERLRSDITDEDLSQSNVKLKSNEFSDENISGSEKGNRDLFGQLVESTPDAKSKAKIEQAKKSSTSTVGSTKSATAPRGMKDQLEDVSEEVILKLPKIPGRYLATTIAFFRYYCEKRVEALVYIYWDRKKQEYELVCPEQKVSEDEVVSFIEPIHDPDREIIMVIHSHHWMEAFFSPVDNRNDQALKVYGVIGRLDQVFLDSKFRAGYNGKHISVKATDLFDFDGVKSMTKFPEEWKEQVKL
jgi:PRTRC genetic system protein A